MKVLETDRLVLRRLTLDDAEFILRLVNEPSWLRYIGDKGVRNLDDARNYLRTGPLDMYERFGFGMFRVELKESGLPIGSCGLLRRDTLPDPDIGYAFLPEHWGKGYALEAAGAVLAYGRDTHGLKRVLAITSLDNDSSIRVLERNGMRFERIVDLGNANHVRLFSRDFQEKP